MCKDITEFTSYACVVDRESNHILGEEQILLLFAYAK
jgi:hypothetical protein